jgi:DUF2075 family protein
MLIYKGSTQDFCNDIKYNKLSDIMLQNFKGHFGKTPSRQEVVSWQNSLVRMRDVIEIADLKDNMVILEYEVPYNQNRIDCLLFGKDSDNTASIVLVELKQWSNVIALEDEGNYKVETYTGGGFQVVSHPSQQVKGYSSYLNDFVSEFENPPPLSLFSCAYCHNYPKQLGTGLFDPVYNKILADYPVYCKEDTKAIAEKIKGLLIKGDGLEIFNRFMQSRIRPSKKLLDNVRGIIKEDVRYSLINEQLVAKNTIWSKVRKTKSNQIQKSVVIVKGGPGTGKSVIALNLVAEIAKKGNTVMYACKSKSFRDGLKNLVGGQAGNVFTNLYAFLPAKVNENAIDVLIIDEAHRIEKSSNYRYLAKEYQSDMPQVDQLIRAARTSVFFIDDNQVVRGGEIGNSQLVIEAANKANAVIDIIELYSQFRCMGSNDYLAWIEHVLGYDTSERKFNKNDLFDFQIIDSPQELYSILETKEKEKPNSARLTAGYCWEWSNPLPNGQLVNDVKIGDFEMPWETKGERPAGIYPAWYEWAYQPNGFKQVGCIYTAQGFEFDYVGVIIGDDLFYDAKSNSLKCDVTKTKDSTLRRDKDNFEKYVKNIYRVLLTRGIQGCYVYFTNKETEKYFRSKMA